MEKISARDFEDIFKEIKTYGRNGKIKSIQGSIDFIDQLNQSRSSVKRTKSSIDSNKVEYGRKDNSIQQLDKNNPNQQQASSNRVGDSEKSSRNQQKN